MGKIGLISDTTMSRDQKNTSRVVKKNGKLLLSVDIVSQLTGVSRPTAHRWVKEPDGPLYDDDGGGFPAPEFGKWMITDLIYKRGHQGKWTWLPDIEKHPFYEKHMARARSLAAPLPIPGVATAPEPDEDQDTRLKRLKADKIEIEMQEYAGTLVNADEIMEAIVTMNALVKTRLLSIPSQFAAILAMEGDKVKIEELLKKAISDILEELSDDPIADGLIQDDEL